MTGMNFTDIAEALATTVTGGPLNDFARAEASLGDYDLLNGSHKYIAVFDYNGFRNIRHSMGGGFERRWDVLVTFGAQYENDAQVFVDMNDLRQEILTEVGKHPNIGLSDSVVEDTLCEIGNDIPETLLQDSGVHWSLEEMHIYVSELIDEESDNG